MPKHFPLRPQLYAKRVEALIASVLFENGDLDLHREVERIAVSCGISPATARMDFQKTPHFNGMKKRLVGQGDMIEGEMSSTSS